MHNLARMCEMKVCDISDRIPIYKDNITKVEIKGNSGNCLTDTGRQISACSEDFFLLLLKKEHIKLHKADVHRVTSINVTS